MHRGRIRALGTPAELEGARSGPERHPRGRLPPPTPATRLDEKEETSAMSVHPPHRQPARLTPHALPAHRPRTGCSSPGRHDVPGRAAEAAPRPHRAGHPRDPARAVAADLRRDVHPAPRDPDRRRPLPRLPRARHHRPVRAVHRDLLRHPDHLGARRRRPGQTAGHPDPAGRAGRRQGVRGRGAGGRPGRRRARPRRAARRRPDLEPAATARRGRGRACSARRSSPACR